MQPFMTHGGVIWRIREARRTPLWQWFVSRVGLAL